MVKEFETTVIPNEDAKLEYKEKVDNRGLAKEIVALSNAKGGRIRIGITDDKRIVGTEATPEGIASIARQSCIPSVIPEITEENHNGINVINIDVPVGKHPPYRTKDGRYMIRVGKRCDDANVDELIDLFIRGPNKGTILLRAKLDDLKNTISASLASHTESGTQHTIEGIQQLVELIKESSSESAKLDAIQVLDFLAKRATGFNDEVTSDIISSLSILFPSYLVPNYRNYIPSEELMIKLINIVEEVFQWITIVPKKTDLIIDVLNAFYRIALGCIWAGYNNQTKRICKIITKQDGRDFKLSKYCQKALSKIMKMEQETDIYEPRRAGALLERITD